MLKATMRPSPVKPSLNGVHTDIIQRFSKGVGRGLQGVKNPLDHSDCGALAGCIVASEIEVPIILVLVSLV